METETNKKHLWLSIVAIIVLIIALAGCRGREDDTDVAEQPNVPVISTDTPTPNTPDINETEPAVISDLSDDIVVARANGIDIYSRDVLFEISRAGEALMWEYITMFPDATEFDYDVEFRDGLSFGTVLRQEAVRLAAELRILVDFASQVGVVLSDEDAEMIYNHVIGLMQEHGSQEIERLLDEDGIRGTGHLVEIFGIEVVLNNLVETLMTTPEAFERFSGYMASEACDAQDRATAILERLAEGEDFATLMAVYGEDPGMQANPDGYTFIRGDMVGEFEAATLELEIGEISGLVPTSFGYHIILRIEPDPDNVMTGSGFFAGDGTDELLGAKHILIQSMPERSHEERMMDAIFKGFDEMNANADIVFLPELDDIPVG